MSGLNWEQLTDVQDGQVVDFEVLSSLINNTNYLKEHAVQVATTVGTSSNNNNSSSYVMKIVAGKINFDLGSKTSDNFTINYPDSQTLPVVFITVANAPTATASVFRVSKSKCNVTVTKGSAAGSKQGEIYWMAIITVKQ